MNSFYKYLNLVTILTTLTLAMPSWAGDPMASGSVLKQDSYVFTIDEAKELQQRLSLLEAEITKQKSLVAEYEKLDLIHQTKESEFEKLLELERSKIVLYRDLYQTSYNRVQKLEKRRTTENIVMASIGVVSTISLILVADAIDDHIDRTSVSEF